jgi:hypothetical protein
MCCIKYYYKYSNERCCEESEYAQILHYSNYSCTTFVTTLLLNKFFRVSFNEDVQSYMCPWNDSNRWSHVRSIKTCLANSVCKRSSFLPPPQAIHIRILYEANLSPSSNDDECSKWLAIFSLSRPSFVSFIF